MRLRLFFLWLALALMLAGPAFLVEKTVSAASYTVNDSGDTGDANPGDGQCRNSAGKCTLRAAIDEAAAHPGVDTINIPAMTIYVGSELRIQMVAGDDQGVIIQGAGETKTILDGKNLTRVLTFESRTSANHAVSNLTIRNANKKARDPVYEDDENYTVRFRNGGAIFTEAPKLTLTNVTLTASRAYQGGGIYIHRPITGNTPVLVMNNVHITNNTATSTDLGAGGGGVANGSVVTGNGVYILNNQASRQGGGWYNNSYQQVTLTNFDISNNTAYFGAGIDNDIGPINLTSGKITGNQAVCCPQNTSNHSGGGGIYNNEGNIQLTNVDLSNNKVHQEAGYGGAIVNIQHMTLTNVSVTGNQATYGAGIYNGSYSSKPNSLVMTNTTLSGNLGLDGSTSPSIGGGIFNLGSLQIVNSTIAKNTAKTGGGLAYRATSPPIQIKNTILAGNSAGSIGPNCHTEPGKTISSGGYNLFGSLSGCSLKTASGDQTNQDPRLNVLAGSQPAYHEPSIGSPAIDRATNSSCPSKDARGLSRPQNKTCDVGAVETFPPVPMPHRIYGPAIRK